MLSLAPLVKAAFAEDPIEMFLEPLLLPEPAENIFPLPSALVPLEAAAQYPSPLISAVNTCP